MEGNKAPVTSSPVELVSTKPSDSHTELPVLTEEELIRIEFYKTYDVMTGVRIAATLGGFFSMMILLVLYKNYCKPSKSLSEEQLNAAVSAAVEEEDRALAAALEATSFYSSLRKPRQSVGSGSQPRFSSPGGPVLRYPPDEEFCEQQDDFVSEDEDAVEDQDMNQDRAPDYYTCSYMSVPADRKLSSITCSSGDKSHLERRDSVFEMGLPVPHCCQKTEKRKLPASDEPWDFYYPIDIQVIQPTPEISPSVSEHTLYEEPGMLDVNIKFHGLQVPTLQDSMHRLTVDRSKIGLAPLASISSLGSFSSQSSPWLSAMRRERRDVKEEQQDDSVGSDSVFADDLDTEDEVEEFETDSELEDGFDDDYSFCELSRRPVSRCERQPRFASFDSCDISVLEGSDDVRSTAQRSPRDLRREHTSHDGVKTKRRLTKTYSEPRHSKQLPVWVERGRSGYVPRRQLSAPAARPKEVSTVIPERPPFLLPSGSSGSDSPTLTHQDNCLSQGTSKDLPSNEKRGRFLKQKTIRDGCAGLLAPPAITISGSCERLAEICDATDLSSIAVVPRSSSSSVTVTLQEASRSSSQETLC